MSARSPGTSGRGTRDADALRARSHSAHRDASPPPRFGRVFPGARASRPPGPEARNGRLAAGQRLSKRAGRLRSRRIRTFPSRDPDMGSRP